MANKRPTGTEVTPARIYIPRSHYAHRRFIRACVCAYNGVGGDEKCEQIMTTARAPTNL